MINTANKPNKQKKTNIDLTNIKTLILRSLRPFAAYRLKADQPTNHKLQTNIKI